MAWAQLGCVLCSNSFCASDGGREERKGKATEEIRGKKGRYPQGAARAPSDLIKASGCHIPASCTYLSHAQALHVPMATAAGCGAVTAWPRVPMSVLPSRSHGRS